MWTSFHQDLVRNTDVYTQNWLLKEEKNTFIYEPAPNGKEIAPGFTSVITGWFHQGDPCQKLEIRGMLCMRCCHLALPQSACQDVPGVKDKSRA